ncbi:hypothetical protein EWI61_13625 [Methylolobus aquaticus]|nr:hypothetical protein EWI61_13625 [Methylolobus aquaticus]
MNQVIKVLSIVLLTVGLLASCAQPDPHPMDMTAAVQNAKSKADHETLATHYEEAAKDMRDKMQEHQKLLSQYKANPWKYGKQTEGLQSHCARLVSIYSSAADENMAMAKMHRTMAEETR